MLISAFTNAFIKKTQVVLFNIGKCTVNMHKQSTTVFLLTKINKD